MKVVPVNNKCQLVVCRERQQAESQNRKSFLSSTVEVRTHRTRVGSWELVFLVQKMKALNVF